MGILALLGVIPAALKAIVEGATPLLKALSEFVVWLIKAMWEGFTDIMDNMKTLLTVAILVLVPLSWQHIQHKVEIAAIHKDYRAKWQPKKRATTSPVSKADQEKYKNFPDLNPSKLFKLW